MKSEWVSQALLLRAARRGGKACAVLVQTDGPVLALETVESHSVTLKDILDAHAHAIVCEKPVSLTDALGIADDYLDAWLDGSLPKPSACKCGPIRQKKGSHATARAKRRTAR